MRFIPVPSNDDFVNRTQLLGESGQVEGTTRTASRETNEPLGSGQRTVWYSWTAPASGRLELSVEPVGSIEPSSYPAVGLFSGDVLTNLTGIVSSSSTRTEPAVAEVRAGTTYAVWVGANWDQQGVEYRLSYNFIPAPPNDDFANRVLIEGSHLRFRGTNWSATTEPGEPQPLLGGTIQRTIWWTWIAPESGWVNLAAQGTNPPPLLAVFEGEAVTNLNLVSTWRTWNLSTTGFPAQAGRTYQLAARRLLALRNSIFQDRAGRD